MTLRAAYLAGEIANRVGLYLYLSKLEPATAIAARQHIEDQIVELESEYSELMGFQPAQELFEKEFPGLR